MKSSAQRQKLYRNRRDLGLMQARSWVTVAFANYLIDLGVITPEQADNPDELGEAVGTWAMMQAEEVRGRRFE